MSKSSASELVRGAGFATDVWTRLHQEVVAQGGRPEDLHLLVNNEGLPLIKKMAKNLVEVGKVLRDVYPVTVIATDQQTYEEQFLGLLEQGNYGSKNTRITPAKFPGACVSSFEGILFHLNRDMSNEEMEKELDEMGLRPATMIELLAFGAAYPDIQLQLLIVELSSRDYSEGYPSVGCLCFTRGERRVELRHRQTDWNAYARFLAVRKVGLLLLFGMM